LKSNRKPSLNAEIFLDYIQTVFLHDLAELPTLDEFAEEFGVLLMVNCSSHATDHVIARLTKTRVYVITVAPHTTQIFQILDMTLFGVLKRRTRYELPFRDVKATAKVIMKVSHCFKQTMVEPNIWGAFQALESEFEFDTTSEPYRLLFNEEKLRENAGFRELWSIDFPLDQLCCQLDGVLLDLVGLIGQSTMTWPNHIYFPLIRYQDSILCQQSEKWKYREIHRIRSKELQTSRLFVRD
jgi:hypothetical protein